MSTYSPSDKELDDYIAMTLAGEDADRRERRESRRPKAEIKLLAKREPGADDEQERANQALLAFAQENPQYSSELEHWDLFRPVSKFPARERERLRRFATGFMWDAKAHVKWGGVWIGLIPMQRIAAFLGRKQAWFYTARAALKKIDDEKSCAKKEEASG